jgi:non-heme chloroperoxidase
MGTITTRDGTEIFYKDWGSGRPVVFSHGWPLTADAWDDQLFLVASNGHRAIARDRRGGGRSGQPWNGNDLDTYADDLAELIEALDLHGAVLVGHSTGGGEVTRYIGRRHARGQAHANPSLQVRRVRQPAAPRHLPAATPERDAPQYPRRRRPGNPGTGELS